ncbi:MAG TPA: class I SAM-dependent methyltransferase [Verrucomicrobiae bacterium]|nr:class I SAM-dependent methyltransferase [Verrucomicrobiae bacterium]
MSASRSVYHRRELEAIAARWDARAAGWDEALQDPQCHLNADNAYLHFVEVAQQAIGHRRAFCRAHGVIDAGCGTGLVLGQVVQHFAWGIGVDISPRMVQAARDKRIPNARFIVGDCFQLVRLCPQAGAILSRGVLLSHYGPEQGEVFLASARPALVTGGFIMCDFLNESAQSHSRHEPEGKTLYNKRSALRVASRAGFSNAEVVGEPSERALILLLQC